jgi:PemK-like, MazF-like toxin of type II toxin-antitoxin system
VWSLRSESTCSGICGSLLRSTPKIGQKSKSPPGQGHEDRVRIVNAPLLRITVQPDAGNGLQKPSQVMVDKAMTVKRDKLGPSFGRINADALMEVERCLAVFLGIAK